MNLQTKINILFRKVACGVRFVRSFLKRLYASL